MDVPALKRDLAGLVDDLEPERLDSTEADMCRDDLDAGEWHMAAENLLHCLTEGRVPVSGCERGALRRVARQLGLDTGNIDALLNMTAPLSSVDLLSRVTRRLLDDLDGRTDAQQLDMARLDLEAGEWHMAVDGLLATLVKRKVPLSREELADLHLLGADLRLSDASFVGLVAAEAT